MHSCIRTGCQRSLAAFDLACEAAKERRTDTPPAEKPKQSVTAIGPAHKLYEWQRLEERLQDLPEPVRAMAHAGLRKTVDYQDLDYGTEYLDRLEQIAARDQKAGGKEHRFEFTENAAKYIANAMCYDDILRVADLKTRASRFDRIRVEVGANDSTLVQVTEYVHPGAAEFVSLMPAWLGSWVESRKGLYRLIDKLTSRGRHLRSDRAFSFILLYIMGGLRHWRRRLLRHRAETDHMSKWLDTALARLPRDYLFAVETLKTRRLIKGYSDTHARGLSKFDRVTNGAKLVEGRDDAAEWLARLITAALADPDGEALDGALETIRSFAAQG